MYSVFAFFFGKNFYRVPIAIISAVLPTICLYNLLDLRSDWSAYFFAILVQAVCCFHSLGWGYLWSVIIPTIEIADAAAPMLIMPFFMLGGYVI